MPVFNNERYFPLAVKSIIEQDYNQWELIIIDDGSTDQTPFIADEIAENDSRITVVHQENKWIYASFNRGIELAKGDYIYILNSDDRMRQGSLKIMAEKAGLYDPDVIWTKVLRHECDEQQNIITYDIGGWGEQIKQEIFYPDEKAVHKSWPQLLSTALMQNQANLYRAEIMKKHKFRTDVYGADTLYNISIAVDVKSALIIKEPVYDFFRYKQDKMNASVGKYYSYEHDMYNEIYQEYAKLFSKWKLPVEEYRTQIINIRMGQVSSEINSMSYQTCLLSTEQKLEQILCKIPDETVVACAKLEHREEELESRILSGLRKLLLKEEIKPDSKMYFVYELLESLLRYEKDKEDFKKIENGIQHPYNPAHIGQIFYNKLKRDR